MNVRRRSSTFWLFLALWLGFGVAATVTGRAQVTPTTGITSAREPLKRVANTVILDSSNGITIAHLKATIGTFGNLTVTGSCTGCGGGGGGGGGAISSWSSVSHAQTRVTTTWDGSVPPPAVSGTVIASLVVPTTAGHRYQVRGLATFDNDNGGATNIALWLTTNAQAAKAVSVHVLSASFSGTIPVEWIDTSAGGSITFQLYGAGDSSNGANFISNQAQFGGTKTGWAAAADTGIYIIDLDSGGGGGGGGGVTDPITVNGWTPGSGTGTVTGSLVTTGSSTDTGHTTTGDAHVTGNLTVDGAISGVGLVYGYLPFHVDQLSSSTSTNQNETSFLVQKALTLVACTFTPTSQGFSSDTCSHLIVDATGGGTICTVATSCATNTSTSSNCTGAVIPANHFLTYKRTISGLFSATAAPGNFACSFSEAP